MQDLEAGRPLQPLHNASTHELAKGHTGWREKEGHTNPHLFRVGGGWGGGESHITPHLVRRLGSKAGVREEERSGTQEHLKSLPPAQRYAPGGHLYAVKNSGGNEVRGVVSVLYEAAA